MVVLQIKVKSAGVKNSPPCEQCVKVEAECLKKATRLGCKRCAERKAGCSLVGLRRKTEKKAERAEEQWRMLSELEANNIPLLLELVELVSQIATSMDLMERLVMGVDRIGKGLEVLSEKLGEKKEKEKEKKSVETQTEEVSEGEEMETESETDGEGTEEEKEDEEERAEETREEEKEKEKEKEETDKEKEGEDGEK